MRCLKEMATVASAPSQRSDTILTMYWGESGSDMGMANTSSCVSPRTTWRQREEENSLGTCTV